MQVIEESIWTVTAAVLVIMCLATGRTDVQRRDTQVLRWL